MTMPKVLSRKEAAKASKLSLSTIDRALAAGRLEAKIHGGRTLIFEANLEKFLQDLDDYATIGRNPRVLKRKK